MNVSTITMNRAEARQAFEHYRAAIRQRHNDEDKAIMDGYRALARGHSVIDVRSAIQQAGVDHNYHPRLAIARADALRVDYRGYRDGGCRFFTNGMASTVRGGEIRFPEDTLPRRQGGDYSIDLEAVVPSVPPQFRPAGQLRRYFILWEADWKRVPKDPMLLRYLGGHLFAVLAVWDLTEIERAVLAGTR